METSCRAISTLSRQITTLAQTLPHTARGHFRPRQQRRLKMYGNFKSLNGEPLAAMASLSFAFLIFAVMPHLIFI
ncbi:hypothetical protein SC1_01680 [Sphingopyxis sp. C-1]|nr:hypothetical protein SC1_01680 [Sphingopyxis sp. C-1]